MCALRLTHGLRLDHRLFRSLFTKDAVLDYDSGMRVGGLNLLGAKKGSPEHISRWLEAQLATFSSSQHLIGNVQITFEGKNSATARAMFFNPMLLWGLNFLTPSEFALAAFGLAYGYCTQF